jgi:hypothetical protein
VIPCAWASLTETVYPKAFRHIRELLNDYLQVSPSKIIRRDPAFTFHVIAVESADATLVSVCFVELRFTAIGRNGSPS